MKKINTYSAQYKIISRTASQNNPHSFAIETMQKIQQSRIRKNYQKIDKNLLLTFPLVDSNNFKYDSELRAA